MCAIHDSVVIITSTLLESRICVLRLELHLYTQYLEYTELEMFIRDLTYVLVKALSQVLYGKYSTRTVRTFDVECHSAISNS